MNNNQSKVSVITVVYNDVSNIEETILSVINQDYPNIEYVVIDGGSSDGTIELIKRYEYKLAYYLSEPDNGIYDAMNKGIVKVKGQLVNFMNSGDTFYENDTVSKVMKMYDQKSDVIYGDSRRFFRHEVIIDRARLSTLNYMPNCHQAFFVKSKLLKENLFETSYKICADAKFFYDAYNSGNKFQYIPVVICNYDNTDGVSSRNMTLQVREIARIENKDKTLLWKINYTLFLTKLLIRMITPKFLLQLYRIFENRLKS